MKNFKKVVAILVLIVIGIVLTVKAATYVIVGSLTTVNNTTNNTASIGVGTFYYPRGTFYITNTGTTSTQALTINIQASIDNSNFVTVATYNPSVTNAVQDTWQPNYAAQSIYFRAQVITTNSVTLGGVYQQ